MKTQKLYKRVEETPSPMHKSLKCDKCFQPLHDWRSNYCATCSEKVIEFPSTPKHTESTNLATSLSPVAIKDFLTKYTEDEGGSSPRFSSASKLAAEIHDQSVDFENIPFLAQLYGKEYSQCNLCHQDSRRQLNYRNPGCSHSYCLPCLQELMVTHPGLEVCYMEKCRSAVNPTEIDNFLTKCSNRDATKVKGLESLAMKHKFNFPNRLADNVDSYLDIGKQSTDTFFLIGIILAQEKLSQKPPGNLKETQQFFLSSFECIPPEDFSQRTNTKLMRTTLQELFEMVENFISEMIDFEEEGVLDPNIKPIVADFILKECQKEGKMLQAIRWMARCALCGFLAQQGDPKSTLLLDKLVRNDWDSGSIREEELFEVFCELIDSKVTFVLAATQGGCKESSFGSHNHHQEIFVIEISHQRNFMGVLYCTN